MGRYLNILCLVLLLIIISGCGKKIIIGQENHNQFDDIVVQAKEGYEITSAQLYQILNKSELAPFGGIVPKDELVAYLDSFVFDEIKIIASYNVELEKHPQLWREFNTRYTNFLNNIFTDEYIKSGMSADSMEVVEHFYGNTEKYRLEEQVDMSQILIKKSGFLNSPDSMKYKAMTPDELDQALKDHAFYVHSLIGKTKMFSTAAQEFSHDDFSGRIDGRIGYVSPNIYFDPFDSVAFSLRDGEWSEPYLDPDGWHIIYVNEYIPDGLPEFTPEVYNFAMVNVLIEKSNKRGAVVIDSLKNLVTEIVYNEELLNGDLFKLETDAWLAIVDGTDTLTVYHLRNYEETFRSRYRVPNTTPELKKKMIDNILSWVVLKQAAYRMKIDTLPRVIAKKNMLWSELGMQIVFRDSRDFSYKVPESLIKQYFEKHKSDFVYEYNFNIQQILCEDSIYCEFVRDQAYTGIDFLDLAKEYSVGETVEEKLKLADIGDVSKDNISPEIWVALFKVKEGEVSHPIKIDNYYRLLKKNKTYNSKSYMQASYDIRAILKERHDDEVKNNFKKKLLEDFDVKYHLSKMEFELEPLINR